MRRVLSGLSLFVLCCSLAVAQPPKGVGKRAPKMAQPAAGKNQPSFLQKFWRELTTGFHTLDDPPPPERGNHPVPT